MKLKIFTILCLVTLTGALLAENKDDVKRLLETKQCPICDLRGANLDGATWTDGRICRPGSIGVCKQY